MKVDVSRVDVWAAGESRPIHAKYLRPPMLDQAIVRSRLSMQFGEDLQDVAIDSAR